ncbi:hypothetical protein ALP45_00730 [Pseudomonas coronafaciens pv. atropurpurea]|uniref:hypothetical protein n=1 Tax=Pseudomonas coronafaciens TaxID=53409 RepID=UPI0006D6207C|nr:hypothetical protein [Pseudomonas coronafaciens]KPW31702.1 Uncharacterized protein ALO66_01928 [Pseudomonas coronafaciens pv. atropurpurea]RMT52733.1 hypothetical protein ALP45_00730 [Pseudomonas coronafaciens pv. atropurpurea]
MGLEYRDMDVDVRANMVKEVILDLDKETIYKSPRLSEEGIRLWPDTLKEAARNQSDVWLAGQIREHRFLKSHENRAKPSGGFTQAQIPVTAPDTLAEGEFNRFYIRGLCLKALAENIPYLIAYRARPSANPRAESEAIIGKKFNPQQLLNDLRATTGIDTVLGLPLGPNSGLSVTIP